MSSFGFSVSIVLLAVSIALNALLLAYRSPRFPTLRSRVDRLQHRVSGRPDWRWLGLAHLMVVLGAIVAVNIVWQVTTLHCADDSLALLASGQAVLHGGSPFLVDYCGLTNHPIPYGLSAVALDTLAATPGAVVGVWIVWELVALAVVPLVWWIGGEDRRYLAVLAATSVLYLPNLATDIGLDNAIVPVSVLVMLLALEYSARRRRFALAALAAFLSTARFPAVFPILGGAGAAPRDRGRLLAVVIGTFLAAVAVSYLLWGSDAISVVFLGEFSRSSGGSLNFFAVLLGQPWFAPSLATAALQGVILLGLVVLVSWRQYSPRAAAAIPLLAVLLLSQYTNFHFFVWLVPVILLGAVANVWLLAIGTTAAFDQVFAQQYLGATLGLWGLYEVLGVVISILLIGLMVQIARTEEARRRSAGGTARVPSASRGSAL